MVVVLLRPLRPLQRPDLVAGHEHALLPAHQLQLRARLQLGEAALVAVGDGGAAAGLDDDARHLAVTAEHAPQVVQGEGGALVAPHRSDSFPFLHLASCCRPGPRPAAAIHDAAHFI